MINKKIKINKVKLNNRVIVGPMCQYSSINGRPSMWHYKHLEKLSKSGAGLIMIESTAINKQGRISLKDLVLENLNQEKSFKKIIKKLKKNSKIGIQISHSGRKGSTNIPWVKKGSPLTKKNGAWETLSSSSIKRDKNWPKPKKMEVLEMNEVLKDFVSTAVRANNAGFDLLEIHMAHGYLLHQFFSPISNKRRDEYGGSLKKRCKYLLKIFRAVRKVWPKSKILGARIPGSDNLKNGSKVNDAVYLAKELKRLGADYVSVTSGGIKPKTNIKFVQGHNLKFAKEIKKKVNIKIIALGMLNSIDLINKVLRDKEADLVAVSRRFIKEPNWFKKTINIKTTKQYKKIPNQYLRCF